jgi:hypothetical protein
MPTVYEKLGIPQPVFRRAQLKAYAAGVLTVEDIDDEYIPGLQRSLRATPAGQLAKISVLQDVTPVTSSRLLREERKARRIPAKHAVRTREGYVGSAVEQNGRWVIVDPPMHTFVSRGDTMPRTWSVVVE